VEVLSFRELSLVVNIKKKHQHLFSADDNKKILNFLYGSSYIMGKCSILNLFMAEGKIV